MGRKVINRVGEKGYNKFGSEMIISRYKTNKDIDVYFPEYDWTKEHSNYNTFKKGRIKCPYENREMDRTGEEGVNNFGSKMIIQEYRMNKDIDVYFPEYDWVYKYAKYNNFKNGQIKCPYERRCYNKGYLGEGKYKMSENGKNTKYFNIWHNMLMRCYDPKYQEKEPCYRGCEVEEYLLNFQNAAEFFESIYYEVPGERMELDKDILFYGNKVYSRKTCIFVPQRINSLFIKHYEHSYHCKGVFINGNNYQVRCNNGIEQVYLGTYLREEEAYQVYKEYKEKIIKEVADQYKQYLPQNVYEALYRYNVCKNY